jgi:hypothetical protein
MNIDKCISSLLALFLAFNLSVFASEVQGEKDARKAIEKKVLIATQESPFKKAVISRVEEALQKEGYSLKSIGLKELSGESAGYYQAIVIVNTCRAWQLNGQVRRFLKNIPVNEKRKIVLLTTANSKNWHPKLPEVDAITSASKMSEAGDVAQYIINRVELLFDK